MAQNAPAHAPATVPAVHAEIMTLAQRYWVRNRLVRSLATGQAPWAIHGETNLYRIDGRKRARAIRDAVAAGVLDAEGVPTDACVTHVPDVEPSDLLDAHARDIVQGSRSHHPHVSLDSEYTPLAIGVWFARHPEGVAFWDRWGKPCPTPDYVSHPALHAAIRRMERAQRIACALDYGLPWVLERHGHVLPEDRDLFKCSAPGSRFGSGSVVHFGTLPEKWGDEAEAAAVALRERIRADRQKLAAVEHVQTSVAKAGGWAKLATQARKEIPSAVDAEIANEDAQIATLAETAAAANAKETP